MFFDAGVGLTIGVLSGTGTRLELSRHADVIVANVGAALPSILSPPEVRRRGSLAGVERKACAVIFDKDGTLLCFHSLWTPWMNDVIER